MIGYLPKKLNINGVDRAIRTDYRVALLIFQAYADPELIEDEKMGLFEKTQAMLECLYEDFESIPEEDILQAIEKAIWFLDGGGASLDEKQQTAKKVMDWEQDEPIIFSAVNKVAGFETRAVDYMHWWTFLGYFNEVGEGLFTSVVNIRQKKNRGKTLDRHEQEFYKENKSWIDLKNKLSPEEQSRQNNINKMLS